MHRMVRKLPVGKRTALLSCALLVGGLIIPTVASASSASPTAGKDGYWLATADGGVFGFGDASFYGSMGSKHLAKPVVGRPRGHFRSSELQGLAPPSS